MNTDEYPGNEWARMATGRGCAKIVIITAQKAGTLLESAATRVAHVQNQEKFSLLRSILRALGLSADAVDDIVARIVDFLSTERQKSGGAIRFPYRLRDEFLSRAEHDFFLTLQQATAGWALACPKVGLRELFYPKTSDPSEFQICLNKIDRKHVDFLLCDPKTMRPLLGIELDDKSHQRDDRRERDEFVQQVFAAANLPLLRLPVQRSYRISDLSAAIRRQVPADVPAESAAPPAQGVEVPRCPKCGSQMLLRTARSGPNAGEKFWGCSNYPRCKGVLKYQPQARS